MYETAILTLPQPPETFFLTVSISLNCFPFAAEAADLPFSSGHLPFCKTYASNASWCLFIFIPRSSVWHFFQIKSTSVRQSGLCKVTHAWSPEEASVLMPRTFSHLPSVSWRASAGGKVVPQGPWKWNLNHTHTQNPNTDVKLFSRVYMCGNYWMWCDGSMTVSETHLKRMVAGVSSMLNSATGTPRAATWGANMAAGYTMEEVPTCRTEKYLLS